MVQPPDKQVKRALSQSLIEFIDTHPRSGWYFAVLLLFNTLLNLLELLT